MKDLIQKLFDCKSLRRLKAKLLNVFAILIAPFGPSTLIFIYKEIL